MARVIRLPDKGRLLVCTDLQGCMRDYKRMVETFEQALITYEGDAHLLFTGDLIHGPHIEPEDWPDFLGEYYRDASGEVMIAYAGLAAQYPGRVHALLGNHEHGHVGGPHTAKFAADEVALLEHILGPAATSRMRGIIHTFSLCAVSKCGAIFTHGAPAAVIDSIADLEAADLSGAGLASPLDLLDTPIVGKILWARSATEGEARRFLRVRDPADSLAGAIQCQAHLVVIRLAHSCAQSQLEAPIREQIERGCLTRQNDRVAIIVGEDMAADTKRRGRSGSGRQRRPRSQRRH